MGWALVGSLGAVVQSSSGGAISGLAYGQTPTHANYLIAWWVGQGSVTLPTTPTGWGKSASATGTTCASAIYAKNAAGGDAVPSFGAITSSVQTVMLAEFSGGLTSSTKDTSGTASSTTSPKTATAAAADTEIQNLVIAANGAFYNSASGTKTLSTAYNNGATTMNETTNGGTSVNQYDFSWGVTTSNSVADNQTLTFTTTHITGATLVLASYHPLAVVVAGVPQLMMTGVGS